MTKNYRATLTPNTIIDIKSTFAAVASSSFKPYQLQVPKKKNNKKEPNPKHLH
jgi:hypothetical protein